MFDESTTLKEYAEDSAGNWKNFDSYARFWEKDNKDDWAVIYTCNRDSSLKDRIDSDVIDEALKEFNEDVEFVKDPHWTVGWLQGMLIRVYDIQDEITDAFKTLYELKQKAIWECLDEVRFYNEAYDLVLKDIEYEVGKLYEGDETTLSVAEKVYEHLSENDLFDEEYDDPAYASFDVIAESLVDLGYIEIAT